MGMFTVNSTEVAIKIIVNDAVLRKKTIMQVIEERNLSVTTEEEFLEELEKRVDDKSIFRKTKRAFLQNQRNLEKLKIKSVAMRKRSKKQEEKSMGKKRDLEVVYGEIKEMTNRLSSCEKVAEKAHALVETAEVSLKKAREEEKKAISEVTKTKEVLKKLLNEKEQMELELSQRMVFVCPEYVGILPEFGVFYTSAGWKVENKYIDVITTDIILKPTFEQMIESGYDSAQEYGRALKFAAICLEAECNNQKYQILGATESMKNLLENLDFEGVRIKGGEFI